jgi:Cof subfamily protein (haloacid dehalogenase superfamily)
VFNVVSFLRMKLFIFDIDQTITDDTLDSRGRWQVYPEMVQAVNQLLGDGNVVLFASGRNLNGIKLFSCRFVSSENVYFATANGAVLYDSKDRILDSSYIPFSAFSTMCQCYKGHDKWTYLLYFKNGVPAFMGNSNFAPTEGSSNDSICQDLNGVFVDPRTPLQKAFINAGGDNAYQLKAAPEMAAYQAYATSASFFEFVAKGVSKANSAQKLAEILAISPSDMYAFGDGENDLEMVRRYHGTAMGNAVQSVKDVAEYVTDTAAHLGVVKALRDHWKFIR